MEEGFPSKFDNLFDFELDKYEMVSDYDSADPTYSIDVSKPDQVVHVSFAKVVSTYVAGKGGRHTMVEYEAFVVAKLAKDYGHIIIKSQSWIERLENMFVKHPVVNFDDDKEFNRKYFVGALDISKAQSMVSEDFRKAVADLGDTDFIIEIKGDQLVISDKEPIDADRVVFFADFAHKIAALSHGRVSSPASF